MCEIETITKIAETLGVPVGEVKLNSEKVYTTSDIHSAMNGNPNNN